MLRTPFLRNLLLIVIVIACGMPLYTLFVLHPIHHQQLIREAEDEAVRFANCLVHDLHLEGVRIERSRLPASIGEVLPAIVQDQRIVKLRFYSPAGEIVFSTDAAEIGKTPVGKTFGASVATGRALSRAVESSRPAAEGTAAGLALIETCVPLMAAGAFGGAIEVLYDVTGRVASIDALTLHTSMMVVLLSAGFLAAMLLALNKARFSLAERDRAEGALRQANEELESRVASRTAELSAANTQLTNEIAERTLARQALSHALEESRRDREKLDGILRSVGDGLIVTDHRLTVLHMNAAAERLLDLSLEQALGQPLERLAGRGSLAYLVRNLQAGGADPAACDLELPGEDPRHPRVYQARFSYLESDQERPGLVLLLHEVTRERELERLKNAFLGMAAHELNTPLTAILGFSEMLASEEGSAKLTPRQREEYLQLIYGKALDLTRLVDDVLDISRVEAGQLLALNYQPVRLDDLLRELLLHYRERSPRHRFELHCATALTEIQADPGRIRQVLNNLLNNAVKYSPQGGLIRVTVESRDGRCRLSIADEGIGMTAEQVERSFDSFYRVDYSNTAVKGSGLGMSIVRHIVQAHHGTIRVESQFGRGTTVHVELPLLRPG